ncbi:hypothetical protein ACNFU2_00490 [Chryseobacterium sp. PTM-20240506]|uniref:hypothetical protein n=1 Tax=unclassified Chryseobacterium TaxID=2593645 RepID=UPI0015551250|nr:MULTISPECIES: hypothetical protein [unclassified Chryseobacterium]MDC8103366.1 hypothetical protein [Chryseobacterium sp. B21-037]MDQ1802920.1 hypothetical protein [Chryseobacterium sp. CKR4-1]
MKSKFKIFVLGVSLTSLTSCALSNSVQKINYQSGLKIDNKLASSKTVQIDPMKDTRGYQDNKVIFYKKNMYNQTMSGAYMAEKPVSEILTDAIKNGLKEKNVNLGSDNKSFTLKSELQKMDYEAISGFSTVQLIPQITVKFQLIDNEGKVVWTDLITGKANTKGAKFEKFLPPAIDNLVEQLVNSQDFLNTIKE